MSPSVRLVCYPDGDGQFGAHAALTLRIDLPETCSAEDVITEIQRRLREKYPLAANRVEPGDGLEGPATPMWPRLAGWCLPHTSTTSH